MASEVLFEYKRRVVITTFRVATRSRVHLEFTHSPRHLHTAMYSDVYDHGYLLKLKFADQQGTTTRLVSDEFRFGPPTHLSSFRKFMSLPTEVVTEVLCNVTPFELISLSHTCKSLRDVILRRTAEYIWSAAENNTPSYPTYPWADISKPRFAGLLFLLICSACGGRTTNSIDPFLLVRLCSKCCSTELVGFPQPSQPVSLPLWELIPHTSLKCDPLLAPHPRYTLRRQYEVISNTVSLLQKNLSVPTYHRWTKETKEEVILRRKFGQSLMVHFATLESIYQHMIEGVMVKRTKAIKRRLRALGWLEEDFNFLPPQAKEWELLISKPTLLTDQEWSELYPKLGPLLSNNRSRVRQVQKERNLVGQNALLTRFLKSLKDDLLWHPLLSFFQAFGIPHQPPAPAVTKFLNFYPFPSEELVKIWSLFPDVGNPELSGNELRVKFTNDMERVKAHINAWRRDIEITLANRLMEEKGVLTMTEAEPLCRVEIDRSDQITKDLPLHTQLLLRADSVFTDGSSKCKPLYYPEFIPTKPQFTSRYTLPIISLDNFHRAPESERIARALLGQLGLKNASYLELATFGERLVCLRCSPRSRKLMSWKGILNHYLDDQRFWALATRAGPRFKTIAPIPMECAHVVAETGNLPLVDLIRPDSTRQWKLSITQSLGDDKYFCFPCKNYGYAFLGSELEMLKGHLRQVHGCVSKIVEEVHYGLIKESGTFLEAGAAWRSRWDEFDHAGSG